ncbi:hypothetical protein QBC32DRAFT_350866 [Pseudoneurospora amorphoporcata]|uniref:Serum paraoxonase/arylesterase family protein n=1 Tax=Pseudoneurospora amorphoporcata TaxID=241081 RepID=A0AAN6NMR3_9PEZI|nr:hypothetical protein QBC32DRAFT_350866 [Pseudoneurospora amorphoporcata]
MKLLGPSVTVALLAYAIYSWGTFIYHNAIVFGFLRTNPLSTHVQQADIVYIPDTVHCEDLHYHGPSKTLFTACEDHPETRFQWFPPLTNFNDSSILKTYHGSLHVIDPETKKSQRLEVENFNGRPFITHGIEVLTDPEQPNTVYIYAVNHLPNPEPVIAIHPPPADVPKARSQIEVFHHVLGTSTARHLRSIWHPLIRTPNDLIATSPTSLYVTNDHFYRDHGTMRFLEDMYANAKWTDVIYLQFALEAPSTPAETDALAGVTAHVALDKFHSANGLGHGRYKDEVAIASAASGVLSIGQLPSGSTSKSNMITVLNRIEFDSTIDNPSYFSDPYAGTADGVDHSGFVVAGLGKAHTLAETSKKPEAKDPVMVWFAKAIKQEDGGVVWEKRLLFEDDGSRIRSASAAVLVAIDPEKEGGQRKAWLFVTGFVSSSVVAVKVDL